MTVMTDVRWIVVVYPKDEPQKVVQIGIYKNKRDAKRRANRYVNPGSMEVVVFESWMQKENG